MDFLSRVMSGNSRGKDPAKDAERFHRAFKDNFDTVKKIVENKRSEVRAVLDLIYDSSFPEEQLFMKTPSLAKLKFNKELLSRLLPALDFRGIFVIESVPVVGMMLDMIQKHGMDPISDAVIALLELLAPLLESKSAPEFTTDDVLDAMDFEWHTSSNNASPFLTALASITSPRASAASPSESPLLPSALFRGAFSDRSANSQRELFSKSASYRAVPRDLDSGKAAPRFSHSVSDKCPEAKQLTAPGNVGDTASYQLSLSPQKEEVAADQCERDAAEVEASFTSGLDNFNRTAMENSRLESQHYEDGVARIQDDKGLGHADDDEKSIARVESGNEVEEPEEENVLIFGLHNSNPIDASPQHAETTADGIERGRNEDVFDREQSFVVDRSSDRLSNEDSFSVPDAEDRPAGEANSTYAEQSQGRSDREATENGVVCDDDERVQQAVCTKVSNSALVPCHSRRASMAVETMENPRRAQMAAATSD